MSIPSLAATMPRSHGRGIVLQRFIRSSFSPVGPREFRGNAGSPDLQSDGIALDLLGADLSRMQGGPLLWSHGRDAPDPLIGTVKQMTATATELPTLAEFLPAGVDEFVDDLCRKLKAGAPYGLSLSFTIEEFERLPGGVGLRATAWTAYELSLCAVPVDSKAVITARAKKDAIMQKALNSCDTALDEHRAAGPHHSALADSVERLAEHRSRAGSGLRALHRAIAAGDADQAAECHARCQRSLDSMARELHTIGDRHQDATDAHGALMRAMRDVGGALGSDTQQGGTEDDEGSRSHSSDFRRRQQQLADFRSATPGLADYSRRQRQLEALELNAPD
jgi:hypothetical protein